MVWYSHLFQKFPQSAVIHTVNGFGVVNKAEVDVFLEFSCFFDIQARILAWIAMPFSRGFPDPGIKPRSPELQSDSLPCELQGLPMIQQMLAISTLISLIFLNPVCISGNSQIIVEA